MGNIVPIHKEGDKQTLKNYRPVLLLHISEKFLKDYCLAKCLVFFIENKLILLNHSGFKLGDMNCLLLGLKLQASPLIYQTHFMRCDMMVSSSN